MDPSLLEPTDTPKGYDFLTSTFYLGWMKLTTEETEARNQEDLSTDNIGVLMDSVKNRMKVIIKYTNNEMKALDRHFNMVLEEVIEAWEEQCQMRQPRVMTGPVDRDRFTSKMSKKPEMKEVDAVHKMTGSEDIARMTLGSATIGQLNGWREEKHPFCNNSTLFPDQGNKTIPNSQNTAVRAKEKGQRTPIVTVMTTAIGVARW